MSEKIALNSYGVLLEARVLMAINYINKMRYIPRYDRGTGGLRTQALYCLSGLRCTVPGRLDLVHPHRNAVLLIVPPCFPLSKNRKKLHFLAFRYTRLWLYISICRWQISAL